MEEMVSHHNKVSKRARMSFKRLQGALLGAILLGKESPDYQSASDASIAWLRTYDKNNLLGKQLAYGPAVVQLNAGATVFRGPTQEQLQARMDRMIYLTGG